MKPRAVAVWLGVLAALGLVFAAYRRPDVLVTLANQLWNCF